jgi:hypothetical protein
MNDTHEEAVARLSARACAAIVELIEEAHGVDPTIDQVDVACVTAELVLARFLFAVSVIQGRDLEELLATHASHMRVLTAALESEGRQ